MQDSPFLSLPAEIRALILAYVVPEKILFDDPGMNLCHNPSHRHLYEPACMFSPCLGLTPSCTSQFGFLFINKQLFSEVVPLLRFHTHIDINNTNSLTILLPRLDFIFETNPDIVIPFRLNLRNQKSTHRFIIEAVLEACSGYPQVRSYFMRALLGTSFHVDCERDIERIANDEQLYPTFGDIKLNPSWRHSLSSVERVTLDGFLTFTVSHLSASVLSDSTQDVGSGVVESKDVEGRLKVPSTYETPWQEHK